MSDVNIMKAFLAPQGLKYEGPDAVGFDDQNGACWIYPTNYPVREYQFKIIEEALYKNVLVTLPTGLGKTFIAAVVMYNFYRWYPNGKVIFLAPTRPLVKQQVDACYNIVAIPKECTVELTGSKQQDCRSELWGTKRVIFATPQVLQNDLDTIDKLADSIRCVVFDEAHKARGNHAYCEVIKKIYTKNKCFRVLALSATPGSNWNDVSEVVRNLLISHMEQRTEESPDVTPYINTRTIDTIVVPLDPMLQKIRNDYIQVLEVHTRILIANKVITGNCASLTKGRIFMTMKDFQTNSRQHRNYSEIMKHLNICITLYHAFELLVRHGLRGFLSFCDEHASKPLLRGNEMLHKIMEEVREYLGPAPCINPLPDGTLPEIPSDVKFGHPKFYKLRDVLLEYFNEKENANSRVIVFFEYKDSVNEAYALLTQNRPKIAPQLFMGQSSMSQRQQISVMNAFRSGKCNTLLSTSIGEEGLDIGEVNLIVIFDISNKSPIRMIQRMGRTGRKAKGRVIILVTDGKEQQTLNDCMARRASLKHCGSLIENNKHIFVPSPRMIPLHINPECVKMAITVVKVEKGQLVKKKGGKMDIQKMLESLNGGGNSSQEQEFIDRIKKPTFFMKNPMPLENLSAEEETIKSRILQQTCVVKHSLMTNQLAELFTFADSKRYNLLSSQLKIDEKNTTKKSVNKMKQGDIRSMFGRVKSTEEDFSSNTQQSSQFSVNAGCQKAIEYGFDQEIFKQLSTEVETYIALTCYDHLQCKICENLIKCPDLKPLNCIVPNFGAMEFYNDHNNNVKESDLDLFIKEYSKNIEDNNNKRNDDTGQKIASNFDEIKKEEVSENDVLKLLKLNNLQDIFGSDDEDFTNLENAGKSENQKESPILSKSLRTAFESPLLFENSPIQSMQKIQINKRTNDEEVKSKKELFQNDLNQNKKSLISEKMNDSIDFMELTQIIDNVCDTSFLKDIKSNSKPKDCEKQAQNKQDKVSSSNSLPKIQNRDKEESLINEKNCEKQAQNKQDKLSFSNSLPKIQNRDKEVSLINEKMSEDNDSVDFMDLTQIIDNVCDTSFLKDIKSNSKPKDCEKQAQNKQDKVSSSNSLPKIQNRDKEESLINEKMSEKQAQNKQDKLSFSNSLPKIQNRDKEVSLINEKMIEANDSVDFMELTQICDTSFLEDIKGNSKPLKKCDKPTQKKEDEDKAVSSSNSLSKSKLQNRENEDEDKSDEILFMDLSQEIDDICNTSPLLNKKHSSALNKKLADKEKTCNKVVVTKPQLSGANKSSASNQNLADKETNCNKKVVIKPQLSGANKSSASNQNLADKETNCNKKSQLIGASKSAVIPIDEDDIDFMDLTQIVDENILLMCSSQNNAREDSNDQILSGKKSNSSKKELSVSKVKKGENRNKKGEECNKQNEKSSSSSDGKNRKHEDDDENEDFIKVSQEVVDVCDLSFLDDLIKASSQTSSSSNSTKSGGLIKVKKSNQTQIEKENFNNSSSIRRDEEKVEDELLLSPVLNKSRLEDLNKSVDNDFEAFTQRMESIHNLSYVPNESRNTQKETNLSSDDEDFDFTASTQKIVISKPANKTITHKEKSQQTAVKQCKVNSKENEKDSDEDFDLTLTPSQKLNLSGDASSSSRMTFEDPNFSFSLPLNESLNSKKKEKGEEAKKKQNKEHKNQSTQQIPGMKKPTQKIDKKVIREEENAKNVDEDDFMAATQKLDEFVDLSFLSENTSPKRKPKMQKTPQKMHDKKRIREKNAKNVDEDDFMAATQKLDEFVDLSFLSENTSPKRKQKTPQKMDDKKRIREKNAQNVDEDKTMSYKEKQQLAVKQQSKENEKDSDEDFDLTLTPSQKLNLSGGGASSSRMTFEDPNFSFSLPLNESINSKKKEKGEEAKKKQKKEHKNQSQDKEHNNLFLCSTQQIPDMKKTPQKKRIREENTENVDENDFMAATQQIPDMRKTPQKKRIQEENAEKDEDDFMAATQQIPDMRQIPQKKRIREENAENLDKDDFMAATRQIPDVRKTSQKKRIREENAENVDKDDFMAATQKLNEFVDFSSFLTSPKQKPKIQTKTNLEEEDLKELQNDADVCDLTFLDDKDKSPSLSGISRNRSCLNRGGANKLKLKEWCKKKNLSPELNNSLIIIEEVPKSKVTTTTKKKRNLLSSFINNDEEDDFNCLTQKIQYDKKHNSKIVESSNLNLNSDDDFEEALTQKVSENIACDLSFFNVDKKTSPVIGGRQKLSSLKEKERQNKNNTACEEEHSNSHSQIICTFTQQEFDYKSVTEVCDLTSFGLNLDCDDSGFVTVSQAVNLISNEHLKSPSFDNFKVPLPPKNLNNTKLIKNTNKNKKKKKMNRRNENDYFDLEAELSENDENEVSEDESFSDDHDSYESSFVNDESEIINCTQSHAMYLQSVRSPVKSRGKFKIPTLKPINVDEIYSQEVSYTENTYLEDSFCVGESDSQDVSLNRCDMSELELAELLLEEQRKQKKRKRTDKEEKKKRRRIVVLSSDSE